MRNNLNDRNSLIVHVAEQAKHIAVQQESVVKAKVALREYLAKHPDLNGVFEPVLAQWKTIPFTMALAQVIRNHSQRTASGRYSPAPARIVK